MEKLGCGELVQKYKADVEKLAKYLPWLREKTGRDVARRYKVQGEGQTLPFPVYDTMLLNFIKELDKTVFIDKNYRYVYSRYGIRNWEDELDWIKEADIMSMDILSGILSRYAIGGRTKACLWTQGVEYQIFLEAVEKAKAIIEYWDLPINARPENVSDSGTMSTERI